MNYNLDFSGKIAIVTGAASGIGKAVALAFVKQKAKVVLVDINSKTGLATAKATKDNGDSSLFIEADVAKSSDCERMIKTVLEKLGKPDIFVNNAGIEFNDLGNLITMPESNLRHILDVNLYGYINCARSIVPHMPDGGKIVSVSSIQGLAAHLPGTSYQASKSAIIGVTRALAIELASRNINVNVVAPGAIATEGMGAVRSEESNIIDRYRRRIPKGRRGSPEEVAGPILFLCSDMANYITGATLVVDGGYLINITPDTGEPVRIFSDDPDR
ncbi:MAG TPA: SDR family NAD(P)-dependent oxidoreductase [Candidatus Humimicrobiaceae bacterium]|nr:SDR family NAD(P)-dependent oxidoreductase [Candidatus Humimicrobiaceae bacterium]